MKSHFSRFLHHIPSHSGIREVFTPSLSHSGLTGVSRSNKFAALSNLDIRVKPEYDSIENTGRSMVEMLGVLAIIGVLSVGAIAGYSKAMTKYKLNQHAVAVNMLINNVLSIKDRLQHTSDDISNYSTLLYKMNMLPDGITLIAANTLQEKYFKRTLYVHYNNVKYSLPDGTQAQNDFGGIVFTLQPTAQDKEICRNILFAAKENSANLWQVNTIQHTANGSQNVGQAIKGDSYCTQNTKCLHNMTLNDTDAVCDVCSGTYCNISVLYK